MKQALEGNIRQVSPFPAAVEMKPAGTRQNGKTAKRQNGKTAKRQNESIPTPEGYVKLLQELLTHQIELKMQNGELRRTQMALETSHAHYIELYDFAPVGYLTLTPEGIIAEINLTAAKLLGVERKKLINRRFAQFITDDYKDLWYRHFMQAKESRGKQGCELPFPRDNGTVLYLQLDFLFVDTDAAPPQLRISLTDVTLRRQSEAELHIAAVAFETIDSIIVTDANKVILRVNKAFTQLTGYRAEEAIGKTPAFLSSGLQDKAFYRELWASVVKNGYWQGELWDRHKNGSVFPVLLTVTAIAGADDCINHYVGSFTDITAQKRAEKVLLEARERLQNLVASSQEELEKIKEETAGVNTALNVILKHRELDKSEARIALSSEVEATVLPLLARLKSMNAGRTEHSRLLDILENNIRDLVNLYGRNAPLSAVYLKLTPIEKQVATLVRQGLSTKIIAATLNASPGTVSIHRKHIRKKLSLNGQATNLCNYLASLTE